MLFLTVSSNNVVSWFTKDISDPTPVPKDIATPIPIYSEDEILAMVQ